jgi:small-conductance mechanosensitive channel
MATKKQIWKKANKRLIPSGIIFLVSAIITGGYGDISSSEAHKVFIAIVGSVIFLMSSVTFLHVLTGAIQSTISTHHLGSGRAASIRFVLRMAGYAIIILATLELLGISIGRLLVGGAAVGIILGVAAQQALANFFASIVLIIAHPFAVGDDLSLASGGLGGKYDGKIMDIGLTHTRLKDLDGKIILFPNSALLSGAAIIKKTRVKPEPKQELELHDAEPKSES